MKLAAPLLEVTPTAMEEQEFTHRLRLHIHMSAAIFLAGISPLPVIAGLPYPRYDIANPVSGAKLKDLEGLAKKECLLHFVG